MTNIQPPSSLPLFANNHRGGLDTGIWSRSGWWGNEAKEGRIWEWAALEGSLLNLGSPELPAAYYKIRSDFRLWPIVPLERLPSQRSKRAICSPARLPDGEASWCARVALHVLLALDLYSRVKRR